MNQKPKKLYAAIFALSTTAVISASAQVQGDGVRLNSVWKLLKAPDPYYMGQVLLPARGRQTN
jgi:hypothetical protein